MYRLTDIDKSKRTNTIRSSPIFIHSYGILSIGLNFDDYYNEYRIIITVAVNNRIDTKKSTNLLIEFPTTKTISLQVMK